MQQDNLTINLTIPTGWDTLDDYRLRYVFGLVPTLPQFKHLQTLRASRVREQKESKWLLVLILKE